MEISGELIFAGLVTFCITVLLALDKLSEENFMNVLLLCIGAVLGLTYGYAKGYMRGKEG